jgi:hypothetical protein
MANLTENKPRKFHGAPGPRIAYPMNANSELFAGAALMKDASTGAAANCVPTASGQFLGFAHEGKNNLTGSPFGGTAGSTTVVVETKGKAWLTVANGSNWARTDSGVTVYASDGDTFTTAAGTNNIPIGKVHLVPEAAIGAASAEILVAFEATADRSI